MEAVDAAPATLSLLPRHLSNHLFPTISPASTITKDYQLPAVKLDFTDSMMAPTRSQRQAPGPDLNETNSQNRGPRFHCFSTQDSPEEIVISMDIGYTNTSVCWAVVNGSETVEFDRIDKFDSVAKHDKSNRDPAIAVIFENDIMPAVGEKQYVIEFSGAAQGRIQTKPALEEHLFYSLKLCLIPENSSILQLLGQTFFWYTRWCTRNKSLLRQIVSSGKVKMVDVFTKEETLREFSSIQDILVGLLRHLLQLTKQEIWRKSGLTKFEVNQLIATRTRIGVSATTAFGDTALDELRTLLGKAGFPQKTTILSEAKSAAIYSAVSLENISKTSSLEPGDAKELPRNRTFMVVDIGGGTTDVAVVKVLSTRPSLKLQYIQPVTACINGSEALNELATSYVRRRFFAIWNSVVHGRCGNWNEESLLQHIRTRFETVKENFDPVNGGFKSRRIFPREIARSRVDRDNNLFFTVEVVQEIFELWLRPIVELVKQQLSIFKARTKGPEEIQIVLTGLGSLPPFIEQHMGATIETKISTINPQLGSSVAAGGFLSMLDRDLTQDATARFSYGIITQRNTAQADGRDQENTDEPVQISNASSAHLTTELTWFIKKGDDLSSMGLLTYSRNLCLENPTFPLPIVLRTVKSRDDTIHERTISNLEAEIERGTIIQGDTLELAVDQKKSGLERQTRKDGTTYIETELKLEITLEGLECKVRMLVPKFGRFTTAEWRTKKTLMDHEFTIPDIYFHSARRED